MKLQFLGSGSSSALDLGNASAVLEHEDNKLCIDYGFLTHSAYISKYNSLPEAVFITHLHMDHSGGLEALFYAAKIRNSGPIKLYISANLVPRLHEIFANNMDPWANEAVNFWDVFHLIPVSNSFFWECLRFNVFSVRHHTPNSAYGIQLPGKFVFTGDTRPIPEILGHIATNNEAIFHDGSKHGNPSHSGIDEIISSYRQDILELIHVYHHNKPEDIDFIAKYGLKAVMPNSTYEV